MCVRVWIPTTTKKHTIMILFYCSMRYDCARFIAVSPFCHTKWYKWRLFIVSGSLLFSFRSFVALAAFCSVWYFLVRFTIIDAEYGVKRCCAFSQTTSILRRWRLAAAVVVAIIIIVTGNYCGRCFWFWCAWPRFAVCSTVYFSVVFVIKLSEHSPDLFLCF